MQCAVVAEQHLPVRAIAVFFDEGEITNTSLAHSHTAKAALTVLLEPFKDQIVPSADTGIALAHSFGTMVQIVCAVLFVVALITTILCVPNRSEGAWTFVLYLITSFVILVKSVDGGIISDGAVIAVFSFGALLMLPQRFFVRALLVGASVTLALLTILFATGLMLAHVALENAANAGVLFLLLGTLDRVRTHPSRQVFLILLIAVLVLCGKAYADISYRITDLSATLRQDGSYLATYPEESRPDLTHLGSIGRLSVYATDSLAGESVASVLDMYGLPYWYQPVSTYEGSCTSPDTMFKATFTVHAKSDRALPERVEAGSGLAVLTLVPLSAVSPELMEYAGELIMHPCMPRRWNVMQEMLKMAGAERAVVYDFRTWPLRVDK